MRLKTYIKGTINLPPRLSGDNTGVVKWWIDASFATRSDMVSQTGATMSMGKGSIFSYSKKQKLNTKSSTEAELVGVDDLTPQIMWTKYFLESQGQHIHDNIVYQDNKSSIQLETNGVRSSSARTRHIRIRYYFVADLQARNELRIVYEPTDTMWGDYFTKPLQGKKFLDMRKRIMNEEENPDDDE